MSRKTTISGARLPAYSANRGALEAARNGAWNLAYQQRFRAYLAEGVDSDRAVVLASADADTYAVATMRRFRYWGTWGCWVAWILAVPTFGLSVVIHLAWWVAHRKTVLGIPAPLERIKSRPVSL